MGRSRQFDRQLVLEQALRVFWEKGFAATSTENLLDATAIGRQSLYNAFGDKRSLYLEALRVYHTTSTAAHVQRLDEPASPLEGVLALLCGVAPSGEDDIRSLGCMSIGSVADFADHDPDVNESRAVARRALRSRLMHRLEEARLSGEMTGRESIDTAAEFVLVTMAGLFVAVRSGATAETIRQQAEFAVEMLRAC